MCTEREEKNNDQKNENRNYLGLFYMEKANTSCQVLKPLHKIINHWEISFQTTYTTATGTYHILI